MRVPMILRDTVNPDLAARAALLLVRDGVVSTGVLAGERVESGVTSVAFPGLGTGVGQVGPNTCARQVRAAIEESVLGLQTEPKFQAAEPLGQNPCRPLPLERCQPPTGERANRRGAAPAGGGRGCRVPSRRGGTNCRRRARYRLETGCND
jgi:hypothetical protein